MKFQEFIERSLLMDLHQRYHRFFTPLNKDLKKLGFNLNEALILLALFFEGRQDVTPKDLVETLQLPKDQVSQALSRLERQSLIHRKLAKTDKRKRSLSVSALGKAKATVLIKSFDRHESLTEVGLS